MRVSPSAAPTTASAAPCGTVRLLGREVPLAHDAAPGTLLAAGRQGIDVACGEGALRIRTLQRAGGKAITAADWLNARRDPAVPSAQG